MKTNVIYKSPIDPEPLTYSHGRCHTHQAIYITATLTRDLSPSIEKMSGTPLEGISFYYGFSVADLSLFVWK